MVITSKTGESIITLISIRTIRRVFNHEIIHLWFQVLRCLDLISFAIWLGNWWWFLTACSWSQRLSSRHSRVLLLKTCWLSTFLSAAMEFVWALWVLGSGLASSSEWKMFRLWAKFGRGKWFIRWSCKWFIGWRLISWLIFIWIKLFDHFSHFKVLVRRITYKRWFSFFLARYFIICSSIDLLYLK